MKNFFIKMFTAHSGLSSKRVCGFLGWLVCLFICIWCTIYVIPAPEVYTGHQSWITNANYYLVKEEGDPVVLKPGQTYFTFTSICNIEIDNIEVLSMDNIGKVNATLTNMETGETLTYEDLDCYLYYSNSWEFVTVLTLPKWAYIEIQFEIFSSEMRI